MQQVKGVRAVVQGDLPDEIMQRIAAAVRRAVLHELADVDLGPRLRQLPLQPPAAPSSEDVGVADFIPPLVPILGFWFLPGEGPLLPEVPDVPDLPDIDGPIVA
ncbi:hypothetical protein Daura_27185 [Dactylosporangium aurantiacum]|uniref:Uncharacterized protein n=1 Tax=Dactylosporangium aurantiacum TaxID=35754 RepID=A0A9Q9MFD0_9ACTN|nr:hypothetical protein [Dactylosporangium aurantiacum]MDG6106448.1 hypothetical protein [Dactylosporangium aurantiacum]UWZ50516.1 hypothetical protein Daura_27185 [Dactylosporangium aurantiacum]